MNGRNVRFLPKATKAVCTHSLRGGGGGRGEDQFK